MRDRVAKRTNRVTIGTGDDAANNSSYEFGLTGDGRYIVFNSAATNLVQGDRNFSEDVFLLDRQSGVLERVSVGGAGVEANAGSAHGSSSDDGRFVVFHSKADNLVPGDTNPDLDVYLRDRATGTTSLVSRGYGGLAGSGNTAMADISGDGRFIVFESTAQDLVPGDGPGRDVFLYEVLTGKLALASVTPAGDPGNGPSYNPRLADDGQALVFESEATDIVVSDSNGVQDIFVSRLVAMWPDCDLDADGKFTGKDKKIFKNACVAGSATWNCDLDGDGTFLRNDRVQFRLGCKKVRDLEYRGQGWGL